MTAGPFELPPLDPTRTESRDASPLPREARFDDVVPDWLQSGRAVAPIVGEPTQDQLSLLDNLPDDGDSEDENLREPAASPREWAALLSLLTGVCAGVAGAAVLAGLGVALVTAGVLLVALGLLLGLG